jgi:hypothetical protein
MSSCWSLPDLRITAAVSEVNVRSGPASQAIGDEGQGERPGHHQHGQ